jgi:transposase-like protein
MPWKECSVVEERLRFVARLLDGEAMTDVCREFGISRKTGYKIFDRYKEHGLDATHDPRFVTTISQAAPVGSSRRHGTHAHDFPASSPCLSALDSCWARAAYLSLST